MRPAGNWQWVFALSIDDEVTWAITQANCVQHATTDNAFWEAPRHGTLVRLREDVCAQDVIHEALLALKESDDDLREALNNTVAVGISTLGVVHRGHPRRPSESRPRLDRIARKSWKRIAEPAAPGGECVLDFRRLLDMVGDKTLKIAAENDATAFCLAEYQDQDGETRKQAGVLCYVLLADGVNVGFLINGAAPPNLPLHPEAGHLVPPRYEHDRYFVAKDHTGCSVHGECFEGLAGNVRFQRQWRKPLQLLPRTTGPGTPLDILSAYAAGLAWAAACAIAPEKFLIGGPMAVDELIPLIRTKFDGLNGGYLPQYPAGRTGAESFIQPATIRQDQGLLGGLEMARGAATPPSLYLAGRKG